MAPMDKLARQQLEAEQENLLRLLKENMVNSEREEVEPLRKALEDAKFMGCKGELMMKGAQLLLQLEQKFSPLTFTDVTREDTQRLLAMTSREEAAAALVKFMGLEKLQGTYQTEILVEYHYHNLAFCQKNKLCPEKTSTFLSIMKTLHTRAVVDEKMSEKDARALLLELIARHSRQLPPYSNGVFSSGEAELLKAYAEMGFFRHYKMYGFAYMAVRQLKVRACEARTVPVPFENVVLQNEVKPEDVEELKHLFADTSAEQAAATDPQKERSESEDTKVTEAAPEDHKTPDDIASAVDEALQSHLGALDGMLKLPA